MVRKGKQRGQQLQLTWHEVLFLLVELVHDDVVTGDVEERIVLLNEIEAVLDISIDTEEVACGN